MKVYKRDLKLNKSELEEALAFRRLNVALHYTQTEYQCANCHTIYKKELNQCPHCKCQPLIKFTKRKKSYEHISSVEVFRKEKDYQIGLLFLIDDYMAKDSQLKRTVYLIRKSEYSDKVSVRVKDGLYVGSVSNALIGGYGFDLNSDKFCEWEYDKSIAYRHSWNNVSHIIDINKSILLEHPTLKYIYQEKNLHEIDNRHIGKALKYPSVIEMLNKRSSRADKYNSLPTLKRYKSTYLKYFHYFEKVGYINPKLLQKLSKIPEMIEFSVFRKLYRLSYFPKELKTRTDLENYCKIVPNKGWFDDKSYKDYLRMAATRGLELSDDVKFNKNWKYDHDQWVKEIEIEKELEKEDKFIKAMSKYQSKKFKVQKKEIFVEIPHSIKDLFYESDQLHHCVKDYSDRIIKGNCLIVFVRIKPGEPFITVEIQGQKVIQMRGKGNITNMILPEHRKAVNQFIKQEVISMGEASS
jgi:hypothetical protein